METAKPYDYSVRRGREELGNFMIAKEEHRPGYDELQCEALAVERNGFLVVKDKIIGEILGGGEEPPQGLWAVISPRTGERTMLGVENLLASIAVPEPFSLEIAGDADGVTLMARCRERSVVEQHMAAHYPQALILEVGPQDDPLRLTGGEQAWSTTMRVEGPEFLPLRTFRDDDLLDQGSDPLIALIGSLSSLDRDERVIGRLHLNSLGSDWSKHHLERAMKRPQVESRDPAYTYRTKPLTADGFGLAALGTAALVGLKSYLWIQNGEVWKAVLLDTGAIFAVTLAGWAYWRIGRARSAAKAHDPALIKEKVSRIAFEARLEVIAILSEHGRESRARELIDGVVAAYRHYDNAAGAHLVAGKVRPVGPKTTLAAPSRGFLQGRDVFGVREVAAMWHPPGAADEAPLVDRTGAKVLIPLARGVAAGAYVGDATAGKPREILFPSDLLRRHHLYVARTRMGKSTLMQHLAVHKMAEKASDRDNDAIVVIDPHADLVEGLLEHVPHSIIDKARLIDLADEEHAPGINLLDTLVFGDRDRTPDSVVRIARGLWDQWGPRMQSILEHAVKSLNEANDHPKTDENEQHTILDMLRLFSDKKFRAEVLAKMRDPYLLAWWGRDFANWRHQYRAEALAPVQTRLSYYASSKRARAILSQPRSTIDMRETISGGGILLVSTSQATVGRDVAALVGASLLNLVDGVIREQGSLRPDERRGALVVVDEMQSMPGVDYESMLSELGKFGASFVLATQSLTKLQNLSRTMQDTILANVGRLAIFQVAAADARQLVWELGKERASEEDITSLPMHNCYVRATVGTERLPTFSMAVRKPYPGDPRVAAHAREAAAAYANRAEEIAQREEERIARVLKESPDEDEKDDNRPVNGNAHQRRQRSH